MTKTTQQKTVIIGIIAGVLAIGLVTSLSLITVEAQTTEEECPSGDVQHWNKIIFQIKKDNNNPPTEVPIKKKLETVAQVFPGDLVVIEDKIAIALTNFGVERTQISQLEIEVLDVKYSTVTCGLSGPQGEQGPQGIQGPPGPGSTILYKVLHDDAEGNAQGWDPDNPNTGIGIGYIIQDPDVSMASLVIASIAFGNENIMLSNAQTQVQTANGGLLILSSIQFPTGTTLQYAIINPPS